MPEAAIEELKVVRNLKKDNQQFQKKKEAKGQRLCLRNWDFETTSPINLLIFRRDRITDRIIKDY
jgi:hypothetical protein